MRTYFIILLGMFLLSAAQAVNAAEAPQKDATTSTQKKANSNKTVCDPQQAVKMPETFY
ncbi:MAG: hypothetical protein K2W92_07975 [Alphaproteobacteria bacterium]|nr:hypothetical protein [Alphaproteobacteria bacterium]